MRTPKRRSGIPFAVLGHRIELSLPRQLGNHRPVHLAPRRRRERLSVALCGPRSCPGRRSCRRNYSAKGAAPTCGSRTVADDGQLTGLFCEGSIRPLQLQPCGSLIPIRTRTCHLALSVPRAVSRRVGGGHPLTVRSAASGYVYTPSRSPSMTSVLVAASRKPPWQWGRTRI